MSTERAADAFTTVRSAQPRVGDRGSNAVGRYLYVTIAVIVAVLVFFGFTRTYWAPMAAGTVDLHPAIHVHAVLFFLWMVLFIVQAVLPLRGRIASHRQLGLLGIALAAMMVFSGVLATIVNLKAGLAGPRPDAARMSAGLSFGAMLLFSTFMIVGIANHARTDWHKRLMVLATFGILQAAVARWIMLVPAIGQSLRIILGAVIVDVMLLVVIWLDARMRGRVHPVYVAGGLLIVLIQWARRAMLPTDAWLNFTNWLVSL